MNKITFRTVIALLLFSLNVRANAPDSVPIQRHTIYGELLGSGALYSLNYDLVLYKKEFVWISFKLGGTYLHKQRTLFFPCAVNGFFGKRKHHLELSLGLTPVFHLYDPDYPDRDPQTLIYVIGCGYRFQKPAGGVFFRFSALFFFPHSENTPIWAGVGLGYTFKKSKQHE